MKFSQKVYNAHQFDINDVNAFEIVEQTLTQLQNLYSDDCVLMSPNDGEIIEISELARVKGILSFIINNRVVEVNPK